MHTATLDGHTVTQSPHQGSQSSNATGPSAGPSATKAPTLRQLIAAEKWHRPVLLTLAQAAAFYGLSERAFHAMRAAGLAPPPVVLGPRLQRWPLADLEAAVASLPRKAPTPEPPELAAGRAKLRQRVEALKAGAGA